MKVRYYRAKLATFIYASGYSLGTAESCTGGRISETIIAIPGASNYFKGGIVAYTDEVKMHLLGVLPTLCKNILPLAKR